MSGPIAGIKKMRGRNKVKRQNRREKRKADRNAKKNENTFLGGGKDEEKALYADARDQSAKSAGRADAAFDQSQAELDNARSSQETADRDYRGDRTRAGTALDTQRQGISDIYGKTGEGNGLLATGLDSAMGTRNNALAAGSLVDSTEDNILANAANAQAQQKFSAGLVNRGAMGLAAGQGESGALALQAAMAGAGQGTADMAAQSNLALADQAAQQRLQAAAAERQNQLALADANAAAQLGVSGQQSQNTIASALATQQARQAQTAAAQAQTGQSAQTNLTLQGQRANLAAGNAGLANQGEATDKGYQGEIIGAKYNAGQARNKEEGRSLKAKVLMPFGVLGQ